MHVTKTASVPSLPVADTGVCPFCQGPNIIGHTCAALSPDGVAALGRGLAVVGQVQREQAQAISDQVDAAYAEYADQPFVEYHDWARSAA